MGDGGEATDSSDLRVRDVPVVILVAVLWLGLPALFCIGLWLATFVVVESVTGLTIPSVTVGLVAAAGGPPSIGGVPTFLAIVAGLVTWAVWVVRYGRHGGDSDAGEKFHEQRRQDRRFDF